MLGLCDRHIAHAQTSDRGLMIGHEKHDGRYVVSRDPDIIFPCFPGPVPAPPDDPRARVTDVSRRMAMIHEVVHAPGFWRRYRYVAVRLPKPYGYYELFVRRDARIPRDLIALEWTPPARASTARVRASPKRIPGPRPDD
jgi:hypothetical protein